MRAEIARATVLLASFARPKHPGLDRFLEAFTAALLNRFAGHWYPEDPRRGNGYRCIRFMSRQDPWVLEFVWKTGLSASVLDALPSDLTM